MSLFNSKKSFSAKSSENELFPVCGNLNFATSEAYKRLRTNILFSFADIDGCKTVGITSSIRGEGKSVTAINLSYSMAQTGKKVLLVDADLRLSSVCTKLKFKSEPGLSDLLVGKEEFGSVIQKFVSPDNSFGFDVISAGNTAPNPAELLGSEKMSQLLAELKKKYDFIFIDLPPVCAVADALIISKVADGMVVVVRQDYCRSEFLKETMEQLSFAEAKILGFVYNGATGESSGYTKYGKYGKHYNKYYTNYYRSGEKSSKENK